MANRTEAICSFLLSRVWQCLISAAAYVEAFNLKEGTVLLPITAHN
jgi:hypothetical protein